VVNLKILNIFDNFLPSNSLNKKTEVTGEVTVTGDTEFARLIATEVVNKIKEEEERDDFVISNKSIIDVRNKKLTGTGFGSK